MKKQLSKRMVALLLALTMLLALALPAGALDSGKISVSFEQVDNSEIATSVPSDRRVQQQESDPIYKDSDEVRVSIVLSGKSTLEMGWSAANIAENASAMSYREELQAEQEALTAEISRSALGGRELDVVWNLTLAANIISANVTYGEIEAIKAVDGVEDVIVETRYEPDVASEETYDPNMATSSEMIGSGAAWAAGYTGAGSKIAIIDTGTDTDHQSFDADAFKYAIAQSEKEVSLMTAEDIAKVFDKLNISANEGVTAEGLYINEKLPFGYNYIDESYDIIHDNDSQGEHGSHVAGIAAANRYIPDGEGGYTEALSSVKMQGVAPDAQIITMKVFGKSGGAYDSDYMAAIEDAIVLGADSINLSLGSGNPGLSTNETYQDVLNSLSEAGAVVCMSAGNSGTWQENTLYGYLYNDGVSMDTAGSPGSYTNSLGVASVTNSGSTGSFLYFGDLPVSYSETTGYTNKPINSIAGEWDFVLFENTGKDGAGNNLLTDYADVTEGKVVMVYRGTSSFYQKHDAVAEVKGKACIVVNNQAGTINMDLSDSTATIPCVSIQQADGESIKASAEAVKDNDGNVLYYTGKVVVSDAIDAVQGSDEYYTMSSFSSWGIPGSLEMKPEITAPGGNIYSVNGAVAGGQAYENMSGTSMASPQMAGMAAVAAQYVRESGLAEKTGHSARQLIQSLLMSTAEPIIEADTDYYYSILNQGAGLANVNDAISAHSYILMADDANAGAADGKVKAELGDDPEKTGLYSFSYTLYNLTDEDAEYRFDTDVFTQDLFAANTYSGVEILLDTWTTALPAIVSYSVDGKLFGYSVDGQLLTAADAQAIADYAAGACELPEQELKVYDVDGDGSVTTYDAHCILAMLKEQTVTLPANGKIDVTVSIDVSDCDFSYYPTGAYIEAYSYATECASEEGVEGTVHSIPVLGYYGSWSAPSMYDVGTLVEYWYETEERYPYLINETYALTNYLTVKYAGDKGEYEFLGNPKGEDDSYLPERNAFNSDDTIAKYYYTLIRNAGNGMWQITDVNTGEVYASEELGSQYGAYYYSNGSSWRNTQLSTTLNWKGTDLEGNKLPEGTEVEISLIMAPEYYANADGSYDWDSLEDGAYMTTRMAIDNTAPEMTALEYDADAAKLNLTASDNRYLAHVALYARGGKEVDSCFPNQKLDELGASAQYALDVTGLEAGAELYIQLTDYAMNQATYRLVLGGSNETVNPTSITVIPASISIVRGTSEPLSLDFEPWLAKQEVKWSSADASIATVDENGTVTGVEVGTTTITATSVYDETVFGTCEVTVKTYDVTLTGALQDGNGEPQLFQWNLAADKTWKKTADLDNNINAITLGENMFQMDTSGYLYEVDAQTGKTLKKSDATIEIGAPVDDMEYAAISSQLFGQDILFGVYGSYLLYSAPAMGNTFSYGWDLSTYLAGYTGSSSFTAIAWVGYMKNNAGNYVDVFYCMTDNGYIWLVAPDLQKGNASLNFFATDLDLDFPGYEGTTYCSMVLGDDDNLYLSYFDGSTNQIYVLEEDATDNFTGTLLGDVGDGVWPCGLLSVSSNEEAEEGEEEAEALAIETRMTAEAEAINLPVKEEKAAKAPAFNLYGADLKAISAEETGRVYMDINVEASTNGLVTMSYDPAVLSVDSIKTGDAEIYSWNDAEGEISVSYADADALSGKAATVVFSYSKDSSVTSTDIEITVKEDGKNFEPSTSKVSAELDCHMIVIDEAVAPTCTESGLTEGCHCSVCGKVIIAQQVIPALGHSTEKVPGISATCTEPGAEDCWKCSICGKLFADEDAKTEIAAPAVIPASGHKLEKVDEVPATCTEPGTESYWRCSVCGKLFADEAGKSEIDAPAVIPTLDHSFVDGQCEDCGASDPSWEAPYENPFIDVKEDDWFYSYVMEMAKEGIINGYADNTFRPNVNLTRAEMVTLLYRASGSPEVNCKTTFTDVPANAWYLKQVAWAEQQGIVNGVGDGMFEPDEEVSREQLVTMLWRLAGKPEVEEDLSAYDFADVDSVSDWAEAAVQWAVAGKIMNGTTFSGKTGTYLAPQDSTTRAEAAKILCVYLEK